MLNTYKIDPKWIQWFIGFADAEVNFQTGIFLSDAVASRKNFLKNGRKILL